MSHCLCDVMGGGGGVVSHCLCDGGGGFTV